MQVGDDNRHPVDRISVGQQFMVRGALLIGSRHHGLQRQITRLDQMPARLRRLRGHPALSVQDSDHERVAAGAQAAFQGCDIQQNPIADRRRSHQVGVGEGGYLRRGRVTPRTVSSTAPFH